MVGKIFLFLGVGLILNWIFGIVVLFDLSDGDYTLKIILALCFFALFPFIYVWQSRGYAISVGLNQLYESSSFLFEGIVHKVTTGIVTGMEEGDSTKAGISNTLFKGAVNLAKNSEKLPRTIRWVMDFFLNQIPLRESLNEIGEEMELKSENLDAINESVFEKVNDYVKEELLGIGITWFWILLGINILAMVATYYFVLV